MMRFDRLQRGARGQGFKFEQLESRWLQAAQTPITLVDLPAFQSEDRPASDPVLPAGFDVFAPKLTAAPVAGAPTFAEWTRSGSPGDSLDVTADQLSDSGSGADTQSVSFGQTNASNATLSTNAVTNVGALSAQVTLGSALPADSMYLVWSDNDQGFGAPVAVNKTDAWWVGPDAAGPGQSVSVFGQNLVLGGQTNKVAVYLEPGAGNSAAARWVTVTDANPYKVTIQLPADLPAGNWQVWAHNGHGGEDGWSEPVSLVVHGAQTWAGAVFDVTKYGAKGDGVTDDQAAIRAAITAAQAVSNSTVYLPAGTYLVDGGFANVIGVRIQGAGMHSTMIEAGPAWQLPEDFFDPFHECLFFNPQSGTAFEDLTLSANHNFAGAESQNLVYARETTDLSFTNVAFDAQDTAAVDVNGSRRVSFEGCDLTGNTAFLGNASELFFDHCNFYMTNDATAALYTWGGNQISLTNNTCQDLNPSDPLNGEGWGLGRFLCANSIWGGGSDVYVADNTTINLGVRSGYGDQNNGEQINWEGTITYFNGSVSVGSANTVMLSNYTGSAAGPGFVVAVVGGKGVGQVRTVARSDGSLVTLDTPWNVVPDATSTVVLETLPHNIVVYRNTFTAKPYITTSTTPIGSTAVEMFQGVSQLIVDGNTFSKVGMGVGLWGGPTVPGDTANSDPVLFTTVARNTFDGVKNGVLWSRAAATGQASFVGNVLQQNVLTGSLVSAIWISTSGTWSALSALTDANVIEGNTTDRTNVLALQYADNPTVTGRILMHGNTFDSSDTGAITIPATTLLALAAPATTPPQDIPPVTVPPVVIPPPPLPDPVVTPTPVATSDPIPPASDGASPATGAPSDSIGGKHAKHHVHHKPVKPKHHHLFARTPLVPHVKARPVHKTVEITTPLGMIGKHQQHVVKRAA